MRDFDIFPPEIVNPSEPMNSSDKSSLAVYMDNLHLDLGTDSGREASETPTFCERVESVVRRVQEAVEIGNSDVRMDRCLRNGPLPSLVTNARAIIKAYRRIR
jgi:hypothetical protein